MGVTILQTVRFSPTPNLGEWLNLAVYGTNEVERGAEIAFGASLARIRAVFGESAESHARQLCGDLSDFARSARRAMGDEAGVRLPQLKDAIQDWALSLTVSPEVAVFDGALREVMIEASAKYLGQEPFLDEIKLPTSDVARV